MCALETFTISMRHPGLEPGSPAWKAGILTPILTMLIRHRQDLNLRGHSPIDFKSIALTTRPR